MAWGREVGTIHAYLRYHHPYTGRCEECGVEARTHYAFLKHPEPHTRDRADYRELCPACHRAMDSKALTAQHRALISKGLRRRNRLRQEATRAVLKTRLAKADLEADVRH